MVTRRMPWLATMAGVLVWAVHFMASYGAVTLLCTRGLGPLAWGGVGVVAWTLIALATASLVALAAVALSARRGDRFVDHIATGVAALAALAVVWETWLVMRGAPCA